MSGTGDTSVRSYNFFVESTLAGGGTFLENEFPFVDDDAGLPFVSKVVQISNDGGTPMDFRFEPPYDILAHTTPVGGLGAGRAFLVGEPVVGLTSGATGTISRVSDGLIHVTGTTGGPFVISEVIRGSKSRAEATTTAGPAVSPPHGTVLAGTTVTQDFRRERKVFLEGAAALAFRVTAY